MAIQEMAGDLKITVFSEETSEAIEWHKGAAICRRPWTVEYPFYGMTVEVKNLFERVLLRKITVIFDQMPIRKRLAPQEEDVIYFQQWAIYLLNTAVTVEIDGKVVVKVANTVNSSNSIRTRLDQIYGRKGCWQEETFKIAFEQSILTVKVWFGPATDLVCICDKNGQVCWDEPLLEAIKKSLRLRRRPVAAVIVDSQEHLSAQKRPRLNLLNNILNDGRISSRLSSVPTASGQFSKSSLNLTCASTTTHLESSLLNLTRLKLVGQFNNEFIVAETLLDDGKRLLLLIDQHAAHERIRLEELLLSQTSTSLDDLKMQACRGLIRSVVHFPNS